MKSNKRKTLGFILIKCYFWVVVLYLMLALLLGMVIEKGKVYEYVDLALTLITFTGAFAFLYKKRIANPFLWRIFFVFQILWDTIFNVLYPVFFSQTKNTYEDAIFSIFVLIPFYACLYLYSFKYLPARIDSDASEIKKGLINKNEKQSYKDVCIKENNMSEYKLSNHEYKRVKRTEILRTQIISQVFSVFLIVIVLNNLKPLDSTLFACMAFVVIVLIVPNFRIIKTLKAMKTAWQEFEILIDDKRIIKLQMNQASVEINRENIAAIAEFEDIGLVVKDDESKTQITVPLILNGYEEIRQTLSQWHEIEKIIQQKNRKIAKRIYISQYVLAGSARKQSIKQITFKGCLGYIVMFLILLFVLVLSSFH
jgi:hypothetical protein